VQIIYRIVSYRIVFAVQGRLAEIEGEFECTKVALRQKEKDVEEYRKVRTTFNAQPFECRLAPLF